MDGDRDRLLQLVLILVDNAIDHAPPGTPVEVALGRRGGDVLLSVTDHGPGIPAEDRERVFEPFARLAGRPADRRGAPASALPSRAVSRVPTEDGSWRPRLPAGGARFEVTLPAHR